MSLDVDDVLKNKRSEGYLATLICHPNGSIFLLINDDPEIIGSDDGTYRDLAVIRVEENSHYPAYNYQVCIPTYETPEEAYTSSKDERDHFSSFFEEINVAGTQNDADCKSFCLSLPPIKYNLKENNDVEADEEILFLSKAKPAREKVNKLVRSLQASKKPLYIPAPVLRLFRIEQSWILDYKYPLSLIQAFGIALTKLQEVVTK